MSNPPFANSDLKETSTMLKNYSVHFIHFAVSTSVEKHRIELFKENDSAGEPLEINSLSLPEQTGWKMQK